METHEHFAGASRIRFSEHLGVRILSSDLSRLDGAELRQELETASALIQHQPFDSLLVLVNVRGIPYSLENVALLRHATMRNRPYVRARAVIGLPEIARFSFRAIAHASGRKMEAFETAEAALDWLVQQA
jgi:hypothetical protein